ncbi:hypothetical protein [Thiothrix winogradskyi]|jgi:hypothetical protein|uniref:Uncharacterized protein n=1 Tax=Thiothrix winogradskyi TaxID=96472 RepID=A0ABY3T4B0_9GAMM|nr:hypothetical protein [Thiothrix winogradskyi]UJS25358.1 hypothetical protein L2Y54_04775 [Thiothrix winogradskyi]
MKHDIYKSWEKILDPKILQESLMLVSMFVVVYEMLEDVIVRRIKIFYTDGFDEKDEIISPRYQSEVKSLNRSPVYASIAWLVNNEVIDDADRATFEVVKLLRNKIVHELPMLIMTDGIPPELDQRFSEAIYLLEKIEQWWWVNFEMEVNPEVDSADVTPGSVWMLKILLEVAGGKTEHYDEFKKVFTKC